MYKIQVLQNSQIIYTERFEKLSQVVVYASNWAKLHRSASDYQPLKGLYEWGYFRPDMLSAKNEDLERWFDFNDRDEYILGEFYQTQTKNKSLKGKNLPKGQYQMPRFWIVGNKVKTLVLSREL